MAYETPDLRYKDKYFLIFAQKTYIVGTYSKRLAKALLMSAHNL